MTIAEERNELRKKSKLLKEFSLRAAKIWNGTIVVIGVSTRTNALAAVVPMFPKDFSLPVIIVQHMPPLFTKLLAERLNSMTALNVEEAREAAGSSRERF